VPGASSVTTPRASWHGLVVQALAPTVSDRNGARDPTARAIRFRAVFGRVSAGSIASVVAVVGAVSVVTAGTIAGLVPLPALASTPRETAKGKVWLLLTSALVADRPIAAELLAFAGFATVVLFLVGPRILWWSAILGHVGSTLTVYGFVGGVRVFVPSAFASILSVEDYGMSAVIAAWIGVVAAVAWRRRRAALARLCVVTFCATSALIAEVLSPGVTVLDGEHLVAFTIGVAATHEMVRRCAESVLSALGAAHFFGLYLRAARGGRPRRR
jgi:hypothetical protein